MKNKLFIHNFIIFLIYKKILIKYKIIKNFIILIFRNIIFCEFSL